MELKILIHIQGAIAFDANVHFSYKDDEWVLKGLSFKIEAGEIVST